MGHVHIRIQDPVLGADSQLHPEVPQFPYTHQSYIHEPLTLMGYLDAITNKVQLVTGILILPQRQTALVDKQGAEVDVLSGGRLRLGHRHRLESGGVRGPRGEPGQAQRGADCPAPDAVDFTGRWHRVTYAGVNPLCRRNAPYQSGLGPDGVATPFLQIEFCAGLVGSLTAGSPRLPRARRGKSPSIRYRITPGKPDEASLRSG